MKLRTASVLLILTAPLSAQVEFQAHEDRLSVLIAGKPFGESTDHPHHRGLSFSHADVNGFNFCASDPSQHDAKAGAIRLNRVERLAAGADFGSAEVGFDWLDPRGKAVLSEDRTMVFYGDVVDRTIDFDIWHARGYGLFDRVLIHPGRTDPAKLTQAYAAYVKGCR